MTSCFLLLINTLGMFKSTKEHKKFWAERKIDWKTQYLDTWNHPHRQLISWTLQAFPWLSLWEVGCGPGANLAKIVSDMPGKQLGGSDVNPEAIALASKTFIGGKFHVESVENMLLSDKAVDVVLSDATLIYIGPTKINSVLEELVRIGRNHIVLCEFHGTSWWKRVLLRYRTGYNAYNYVKLLEKAGCYDIQMGKIPVEYWAGTPWEEWGYIITAKLPQK